MSTNHKLTRNTLAVAVSSALAMTPATIVYAEENPDQEKDEVITVTANRREQTLQEIPYNISAISGETLSANQIVSPAELMRQMSGVTVVDRGPRNAGVINGISIRGMNVDSSALGDYALSTVPTVSTYVNDTPVYANFMLKDVDRVEVLRGPQGTLYGSGSLGGTVKYIMNRPDLAAAYGVVEGSYSVTDDSDGNNWSTDVVVNVPLSDSVGIRLAAGMIDYAGSIDLPNAYEIGSNGLPVAPNGPTDTAAVYTRVVDADSADISYYRASLLVDNDNFNALLTVMNQDNDIGGRRHRTNGLDGWGEAYGEAENGSIQREPSTSEVDLASLELDFDLGFATLTSSTSSYETEGESVSENTGFYAQLGWLSAFYYNYPRPMASAVRTYEDEAFVQELRLVSNGDQDIDWVVGIFHRDNDLTATQDSILRGFQLWADTAWGPGFVVNDNDFAYTRVENFTEQALFGELTFDLSEDLAVTLGARWFNTEYENQTDMMVGLYTSFNVMDQALFEGDEDDTLFKANLSYDLADDKMLYATLSEGYRRGGSNAVPLSGTFAEDPAWQQYDPDRTLNFELGLKGNLEQGRYNVSFFYVDWEDIQLNTATTNWAFFAAQNAGAATNMGLETEFDGYFGEGWHYTIGYTYLQGELSENMYAPNDVNRTSPVATDGTRLPGQSDHTFSLSIDHTQSLSGGVDWTNRFGLYYQSDSENAINESIRFKQTLDSFAILDFNSTFMKDDWSVTLWIKNLTNEAGVTGVFKEEYMGTSPEQNYFGNGSKELLSQPRTIGITARYHFE